MCILRFEIGFQQKKKKFRLVKRGLHLLAEALTKVFDGLEGPVLSQFALHTNRVHLNRFFQIYSAAANHFAKRHTEQRVKECGP